MKKTTSNYIINHEDKTITITKDYAKRSSVPGSKEFRELAKLHNTFADYDIQRRTAVIKADKNTHNGLTLAFMEKYISTLSNSEEALKEFEAVKAYYKDSNAYYGKVKAWFLANHNDYENVDLAA
ncbi:MAG: hypothetical protein PHY23_03745 [Oscillospiraceae bacterium]|nr:hypothetical protein [Oscillospiraceae bacterium]